MRRVLRILAALSFVAFSGVLCAGAENAEAFSGSAVFYSFPLKKQIEETPENERFALLIGRKVDVDEFVDFCEKYPDIAKREQLSSAEAEAKNQLVRKLATQMPEAPILERAKQATQLLADLNNSETSYSSSSLGIAFLTFSTADPCGSYSLHINSSSFISSLRRFVQQLNNCSTVYSICF